MSDYSPAATALRAPLPLSFGVALFAAVGGAAALGLALGHAAGASTIGWDAPLVTLLRFTAAVKFAGVLAGAALVRWRATFPMTSRGAGAYVAALATMALAPGMIWTFSHIALAAGLFHVGLLSFLLLAWRDSGGLETAVRARRRRPVAPATTRATTPEGTTAQPPR